MKHVIVIAHNIRSTHNVGSIFRTSEGLGVEKIILSGYSPYPKLLTDTRLPHLAEKITKQIHKTALGAESIVPFEYQEEPDLTALQSQGYVIVGLEQDDRAVDLITYQAPEKVALLIGEEVDGINQMLRDACDTLIEIPMVGQKESFNVSVATGIALYSLLR